jgi:hypothetical protein
MEIRKKIIVDIQTDSEEALSAVFNDASVDSFETKPVAGFTQLPCFGALRCYGRMTGKRDSEGRWDLTEEYFYGQGANVPENTKAEQTAQAGTGISSVNAAKRVVAFKPADMAGGWF